MINKTMAIAAIMIAALAVGLYMMNSHQGTPRSFIDPSDQKLVQRGKTLYATHCAACHGVHLEGQPDWRTRLPNGRLPAPPHDVTGHTWHHPDAVLVDIVKFGLVPGKTAPEGYESDMPGYAGLMTDSDVAAVLAYIKSSWPPDALAAQKKITLQQMSR